MHIYLINFYWISVISIDVCSVPPVEIAFVNPSIESEPVMKI